MKRNLLLALALLLPVSLTAQNRDFRSERLVIDDDAGDGTQNTLTLQTPLPGLSTDRTLTFPDADGMVVTTGGAPLTANQILFGNASGQIAQSASLLWDDGTGIFDIGGGNFTVAAATGALTIAGVAGTPNVRLASLSGNAVATPFAPTATDGIIVADANGDLLKRSVASVLDGTLWSLTGNAGTVAGTNFLGTLDSVQMEIRVNDTAVMRYLPDLLSPMILGGVYQNAIDSGSSGSVIAGGGSAASPNLVDTAAIFSAIGGGLGNSLSADYAVLAGGRINRIADNATGSVISGGDSNQIMFGATYGAIGGGYGNLQMNSAYAGTIGGGYLNTVTNGVQYGAIGGGRRNLLSNSSYSGTVAGGDSNTVTDGGSWGAIGGGRRNYVGAGSFGTVGGGDSNRVYGGADYGTIGGGDRNLVEFSSPYGTVGGGGQNVVMNGATYGTISGGSSNRTGDGSTYGTVGGGRYNRVINGSNWGTIAGGDSNVVINGATSGTVGGGTRNRIESATRGTIGGGDSNQVLFGATYGTIGGGFGNLVTNSGFAGAIGGGYLNTVTNGAQYGAIGGGRRNLISNSTVGGVVAGGDSNTVTDGEDYGAILGGRRNFIGAGSFGTIGGGDSNRVYGGGDYGTVSGGYGNRVEFSSQHGSIGGGRMNSVASGAAYGVIAGGDSNSVISGPSAGAIGGGTKNLIANSSSYSTIGGGHTNTVTDGSSYGAIAGGGDNLITNSSLHGSIGGGDSNVITNGSSYGVIAGGGFNMVTNSSSYAAIGGGQNNLIDSGSTHGVIAGGLDNNLYGSWSTIAGGRGLTIDAPQNFGFHANDPSGTLPMTIADTGVALFGNVDLWLANNDNDPGELRFYEAYNTAGPFPNGTNYVAFRGATTMAADVTWTLPAADGTSGQVLSTDGAGTLSWITNSATVSTDATLTGDGSGGSPLGINLANQNAWTAEQSITTGSAATPTLSLSNTNATGVGLEVTDGRVLLSYGNGTATTIPSDVAVWNVDDEGTGAGITVALPTTAANGQILYVYYSDADAGSVGGTAVNQGDALIFVHTGGAWRLFSVN